MVAPMPARLMAWLIVKQGLTCCPQVGESRPSGATNQLVGGSALTPVTIPKKRITHPTLNVPSAIAKTRRSLAVAFIYIQVYGVSEKTCPQNAKGPVLRTAVTLSRPAFQGTAQSHLGLVHISQIFWHPPLGLHS